VEKHDELRRVVGYDLNVKSTPEVSKLLFETLRLPTKYKRSTGNITTDEDSLKELRASYPEVKELNLILEERHLRTKLSNYIDVDFDKGPDGSRYLSYMANIGGTKTGRWSFSKSPKWIGSSPQTLPKVMRLMYQPPPGSVFFQRDLSQAEARMVAWLSDCRFLLDTFASPIKIHKVVGSMIFEKPPDAIITDSIEYDVSKRVVHAYDYMQQAKAFAIQANVSYRFAQEVYAKYSAKVPEISQWWNRIKETVLKTGRLVTPMGRVRECFKAASAIANSGQLPDEILRDLVSYIPQSTVPDLTNEAMLTLYHGFPVVKWHQQGHDSFLASGPPSLTSRFYEASEEASNIHFIIGSFDCYIPGEFQWGYLWGAMLKYIPGEDCSYEAWQARATKEGYFELEGKNGIKSKLISLLT
jgi:DNA polymerase-1